MKPERGEEEHPGEGRGAGRAACRKKVRGDPYHLIEEEEGEPTLSEKEGEGVRGRVLITVRREGEVCLRAEIQHNRTNERKASTR